MLSNLKRMKKPRNGYKVGQSEEFEGRPKAPGKCREAETGGEKKFKERQE